MANIMTALKAEIVRLSRKEVKAATAPVRKPYTAARKSIADLKRRVADLEKQTRQINALLAKIPQPEPAVTAGKTRGWISGKGVRSLRTRLGLSQEAFGKLVGVTTNGISKWESKPGMLRLRTRTREAVLSLRGLTARAAKQKLEEMATAGKAAKPAGKRSKAKAK
jgi:DNA-binding transcriptional regulator YiaG